MARSSVCESSCVGQLEEWLMTNAIPEPRNYSCPGILDLYLFLCNSWCWWCIQTFKCVWFIDRVASYCRIFMTKMYSKKQYGPKVIHLSNNEQSSPSSQITPLNEIFSVALAKLCSGAENSICFTFIIHVFKHVIRHKVNLLCGQILPHSGRREDNRVKSWRYK